MARYTTQCILTKGNETIVFESFSEAAKYLGVNSSTLSGDCTDGCKCKGYSIARGEKPLRHGESKTRLHNIWCGMRYRCENISSPAYKYYGGRGISICEEWSEYLAFKEWSISHGYSDSLTIDRVDVNGDYSPQNCRWVSMKTQCNNRSSNINVEYQGATYTLMELCKMFGANYKLVVGRVKRGWNPMEAITTPVSTDTRKVPDSQKSEWKRFYSTTKSRLMRGTITKEEFYKLTRAKKDELIERGNEA